MIRAVTKFTIKVQPDGTARVWWTLRHWHPKINPWRGEATLTNKDAARLLVAWLRNGAWWMTPGEQYDLERGRPVPKVKAAQ